MKIAFAHSDYGAGAGEDGGTIFDRRLITALNGLTGVEVQNVPILRIRDTGLPIWRAKISAADRTLLAKLQAEGVRIVLSHEALFGAAAVLPGGGAADILIVHNFMPRFHFPGRPVLSRLYRAGSERYFRRYLQRAKSVFWLSNADFRSAAAKMPGSWQDRSFILAPPPRQLTVGPRDMRLIHLDGTTGWRAKKLSRLTDSEMEMIRSRYYSIGDFGTAPNRAFGIVTDRFSIGFKLKLMQMIYARDVIASFTDLAEDVRQVAPDYPFYRTVGSVSEALDYFDSFGGTVSEEPLDKAVTHLDNYTWEHVAGQVLLALGKTR